MIDVHTTRSFAGASLGLSLGLSLLAITALSSPAAAESWEALSPNPNVSVIYRPPANQALTASYNALKARKVLEEYQRFLSPLRLPHHLDLVAAQCNMVNAFYNSQDRSLTLCYELIADALEIAPATVSKDGFITRQAAIIGNVVGTLFHESGHMSFDMFDVPRFGREEDAADQMAIFIPMQFSVAVARSIVKGWAYYWKVQNDPSARAPVNAWADEHGTASQRLYNGLCLAYGGDSKTFQDLVDQNFLPKARVPNCAAEFDLVKQAFVQTIYPFIDQALMARVQKADWLTPDELK